MSPDAVSAPPALSVTTKRAGDEAAITCSGKITGQTADELSRQVRALIPDTRVIVLDLHDVSYLDSSGLGVLVRLYVSARKSGKHLRFVKLSDRVAELFRITKLANVFEGYGEYL